MAKDLKPDVKPPEEINGVEATSPTGIPRLYILLGLVSLILLQTTLLAFLLPSREAGESGFVETGNEIIDRPGGSYRERPVVPESKSVKIKTIEKPLGKPEGERYRVQDVERNNPSAMSGFSCSVYCVIKESDEKAFDKIYEKNVRRIDDLIQTILRESTLEERLDPRLGVIRGRIKRRVSEDLDIPYILEIIINNPQTESM